MNCNECVNYGMEKWESESACRTMLEPLNDKSCFMTKPQAIKAENDIINYTKKHVEKLITRMNEINKVCDIIRKLK